MLRHQAGVDPDRLGAVLDLAAVGLVNGAWRNSPVEQWHAGAAPLSDGDMLRINSHTTWRVREIMRRWRPDVGIAPDSTVAAFDAVAHVEVEWLAERIFDWMTRPTRALLTGVNLEDLAGDTYGEFRDHVDRTLGSFVAGAERRGTRYAFWRAAAHGGLACRHWWGTPSWPAIVAAFLTALDNPADPHWGTDGNLRTTLRPAPPQLADRAGLRRTLLQRPWDLAPTSADWIVSAGIGHLQPSLPNLPERDVI